MAGRTDQVEVPRVPVGRLEPRASFAEVHLAGESLVHHPLQRAIHRGAADSRILAVHEADEIVGAQMAFLLKERAEDVFALGGTLAARGAKVGYVWERTVHEESGDW